MGRVNLRERLRKGLFLLDGAIGTELIAQGVEAGTCNDYLNIESSEMIEEIHESYIQAGSDGVITNTFGANGITLGRHRLSEKVEQINNLAVQIARRAAGEEKYILGGIGPSGDFLRPLGNLQPERLREAFAEQTRSLSASGVDGIIIETMTGLDEISIAIEAVRGVCDLPVLALMSFDSAGGDFKTMMGVDVESAVSKIVSLGVDAVGFNCGKASLEEYAELAGRIVSAVKTLGEDTLICAEPNAGKPELVDGRTVYKVDAEDFAATAEKIYSAGVSIIGGCCGTGPAHIEAVAKRLGEHRQF